MTVWLPGLALLFVGVWQAVGWMIVVGAVLVVGGVVAEELR